MSWDYLSDIQNIFRYSQSPWTSQVNNLQVLSSKERDLHISDFVCDIDAISQVLSPGEIYAVSAEEVSAATVEQFCALDEDIAKEMVMVLMGNADFTPIIDKVSNLYLKILSLFI